MKWFRSITNIFNQRDAGVTSIEYALIASLIAVVIVVSVDAVGDQVLILFEKVVAAFN